MKATLISGAFLSLVLGANAASLPLYGIHDATSDDVTAAVAASYDYVVVGGGTAGLALAGRLSESGSHTVLVIEAGALVTDNSGIIVPGLAGSTFQSSVDWIFATTPQANAAGRSVYWPRGKVLGGSSALNFLAYTKGWGKDFDNWGASEFDDENMLAAMKKSEHWYQNSNYSTDAAAYHGTSGPLQTSHGPFVSESFSTFYDALSADGYPTTSDLDGGVAQGLNYALSTVNPTNQSRATSYTAYIAPYTYRKNLLVLTNLQANKAILNAKKCVTGVNTTLGYVFNVKKEAILSAGAIQTPQLLELSGIGNPTVLAANNITPIINNTNVGENLQDHPGATVVFELKDGIQSLDSLSWNSTFLAEAEAAYAEGQGPLTQCLSPLAYVGKDYFMNSTEISAVEATLSSTTGGITQAQLKKQAQTFLSNSPILEFLGINLYFGNSSTGSGDSGVNYFTIAACLQHAFSRGSIHISSGDVTVHPSIDPNYLAHPADSIILSSAVRFIRKLAASSPLADIIKSEAEPGSEFDDAAIPDYVARAVRTEFHPAGTAAIGTVVDGTLKVKGTQNLRVCDLSVFPIHISAHPQAAAYGLGERLAELILA